MFEWTSTNVLCTRSEREFCVLNNFWTISGTFELFKRVLAHDFWDFWAVQEGPSTRFLGLGDPKTQKKWFWDLLRWHSDSTNAGCQRWVGNCKLFPRNVSTVTREQEKQLDNYCLLWKEQTEVSSPRCLGSDEFEFELWDVVWPKMKTHWIGVVELHHITDQMH